MDKEKIHRIIKPIAIVIGILCIPLVMVYILKINQLEGRPDIFINEYFFTFILDLIKLTISFSLLTVFYTEWTKREKANELQKKIENYLQYLDVTINQIDKSKSIKTESSFDATKLNNKLLKQISALLENSQKFADTISLTDIYGNGLINKFINQYLSSTLPKLYDFESSIVDPIHETEKIANSIDTLREDLYSLHKILGQV